MTSLCIQTAVPKHSQYASKTLREASYSGWPSTAIDTPQVLADAGFFYTGFGDCVRCFFCGIGFKNLEYGSGDPWIEHAEFSRDCVLVKEKKGQEFVNLVQLQRLQYTQDNEAKTGVPSWALDMIKQLISVIDGTLMTATGVLSFLAKRFPSLFPDLKREPTEKDLFTFAEAIGNNFKQLGHALGVSASKLDRISMDNETSLMKIYSMLKEWQSSNPLTASLESLVKTMKTCKSVTVDWDKIGKACF